MALQDPFSFWWELLSACSISQTLLLSNSTTNTFYKKDQVKKSCFLFGSVRMSWYKHLTVRRFWSAQVNLHAPVHHTCSWTTTSSDSFPSFSLAFHARQAMSFTIINTSRQYHMTRGPTLTCDLLDITTCRLKFCFQQTNPITGLKGSHCLYKKKHEGGRRFHIGLSELFKRVVWQREPSSHQFLYTWVFKRKISIYIPSHCSTTLQFQSVKFLLIQNLLEMN